MRFQAFGQSPQLLCPNILRTGTRLVSAQPTIGRARSIHLASARGMCLPIQRIRTRETKPQRLKMSIIRGARWNIKVHIVACNLADELRVAVGLQVAFRLRMGPAVTGRSKTGAQIADRVDLIGIFLIDGIVDILQIPVIRKCHHYAKAIEFSGPDKRVLLPTPQPNLLLPLNVSFETSVF